MRDDDLLALLRQRPFQPFQMHLTNGTTYEIRHPELVMAGRSRAVVGAPSARHPPPAIEKCDWVALLHITRLEPIEPSTASSTS
jgi:hypothetical protein